ncbi:MAG TPA: DUF547 domain-containing protein [Abditibacteriaceae bacterium]|nr:DUF547 domain-containing protein [Abditibacteriaceae bacterium]
MKRIFFGAALAAIVALGAMSAPPALAADALADAPAGAPAPAKAKPPLLWSDFPSLFDAFLFGKVDKVGNMDYLALKGDKKLDRFIEAVATADLSKFPTWTLKDKDGKETIDRSVELVFWINAFNGHVLKTIADAYPVNSPYDIKDFDTAKTHTVAGKTYSLAEMRDKIGKADPRTIFALINGTRGGPLLAPAAYRYKDIDYLLTVAVAVFVNLEGNVVVDRIKNTATLNEFFAQADPFFKPSSGRGKWPGIRAILKTYVERKVDRNYFTTNDYQIKFKPSDSRVNNRSLTGVTAG